MKISDHCSYILSVVRQPRYAIITLIGTLIYLCIGIYGNELIITLPVLSLVFAIPFVLILLFVALLVGINIALIAHRIADLNTMKSQTSLAFLGAFGGLLGGACPACVAGLFPAIIGLFGLTFSLNSLPLYGLEVQIISILLLCISLIMLSKQAQCKVSFKKK